MNKTDKKPLDYEKDKTLFSYENLKPPEDEALLCEAKEQYVLKRQGEFTLRDYYALPQDRRVELIDGVIYDMAAPDTTHQIAVADVWRQLTEFIRGKGGACRAFVSPVDVQLDCDDRTMIEPDVLIVCDNGKIRKRCIYGAPDFVAEVLSDSTARKDATVKLTKYLHAGVREYWMIDLQQEKVIVYDQTGDKIDKNGENCCTVIYGMEQNVPVAIFGGECRVSFKEICEEVRQIMGQP